MVCSVLIPEKCAALPVLSCSVLRRSANRTNDVSRIGTIGKDLLLPTLWQLGQPRLCDAQFGGQHYRSGVPLKVEGLGLSYW